MKIAYLILAHKDPEQLGRLITKLRCDSCKYYIHFDKKSLSPSVRKRLFQLESQDVFIISSHNVRWGTISQTEARLDLIKKALSDKTWIPDYLIMISGQSYPIKPINDFLSFLEQNKGASFMEHFPIPFSGLGHTNGIDRINCYSYYFLGKLHTYYPKQYKTSYNFKGKMLNGLLHLISAFKPKRVFPEYIKPYYGIDWWALTSEAAVYILDFYEKHPDYHKYHKFTKHTCEVYFPSILAGTNFNGLIINNSLHYFKWLKNGSGNTKVLTMEDAESIKQTNCFFARKFDKNIDADILDFCDHL